MDDRAHIPVLLEETLAALAPTPGQTALDCTAGLGGHAAAIAQQIGPTGRIALCDADPGNLEHAAARIAALTDAPAVTGIQGNFADAPRRLAELDLSADVVLADLGFSSPQMADPQRGLSFSREGPLDMRFDPSSPVTAAELVNTLTEQELADLIYELGEERDSRRIARKLIEAREAGPIETTTQLAEIVRSGARPQQSRGRDRGRRIHPATRTFQALRIAVNDELGSLAALLEAVKRTASASLEKSWLRPGARVGVISFHSLEDRPVKRVFGELAQRGLAQLVTRKPITPTEAEVQANPRSRSAKLRVIELTPRA